MQQLRGRGDEVEHALRQLQAQVPAVAVVAEAGMGVSRLLEELETLTARPEAVVLRAAGRRSEAHIDLAVLRELAAQEPGGSLARALTRRGEMSESEVLLDWAEASQPAIVVVDDVHEADDVSRAALDFLARRTGQTSVIVLIGTHRDTPLPAVELGPLSLVELAAIVRDHVTVDDQVATRIAELAQGSPLLVIELAKSLRPAQLSGDEPLPLFPVSNTPIRHVFDQVVRELPAETRNALCVAAAEPTGDLRAIASALTLLNGSVADLEPAEAIAIVAIDGGNIAFDHPIRRAVCYQLLAPASRRAAHRAIATALDAPHDAERRAAHLASGFVEPNEQVASDLEFVAAAADKRGDEIEARRWWTRAAELSPSSGDAERRRAAAQHAAQPKGDPVAGLTKAERRVAAVVGSGASNKEAAATLYVSVKTVDAHLQSIYRKLGIRSRTELAVLIARRPDNAGST